MILDHARQWSHFTTVHKMDPAAQLILVVTLKCIHIKPLLPEMKYADGSTETNGQK
jgi:hypothetical protein